MALFGAPGSALAAGRVARVAPAARSKAAPPEATGPAGSATVSGASRLLPGERVSGDIATDAAAKYGAGPEFWLIPVIDGDEVTVKESGGPCFMLLPVGTTDAEVRGADPLSDEALYDNATLQVVHDESATYDLSTSGEAVAAIDECGFIGDSYQWSYSVTHEARLFVPTRPKLGLDGTLVVAVENLNGSPITSPSLTVIAHASWRSAGLAPPTWHVVGSAHPKAGYAAIPLRLPRLFATHKTVPILLTGGGGGYRTLTPVTVTVTVRR